ncbi:hypothetical protein [Parasitella parasitica]|uniref:C2H2-type domain-containing protein n=1 Tax=Parasitella parasitica TaxID=35722 RepID=A0A0B7N245_9FUNG|nr:hypothetical protein [Parasitella parasitica]CEP15983.1 hypothetical protein [Parasitella parasitica]
MVYTKEYKKKIAFEYPCYICGTVLSKARQVLNHVNSTHGYDLPARPVGRRRPEDPKYTYVNNPQNRQDFEDSHFSCSSCWFHCPANDKKGLVHLAQHINKTHRPVNVDSSKNNNGQINGGQVDKITRYKTLPDHQAEDEEDELQGEEDEDMDDIKRDSKQIGISDVYQKLSELTAMFQNLFNGKDQNDNSDTDADKTGGEHASSSAEHHMQKAHT